MRYILTRVDHIEQIGIVERTIESLKDAANYMYANAYCKVNGRTYDTHYGVYDTLEHKFIYTTRDR